MRRNIRHRGCYHKAGRIFFKVLAWMNAAVFILSACCADSSSDLPIMVCVTTLAYHTVYAYANDFFTQDLEDIKNNHFRGKKGLEMVIWGCCH